jgi:hypothetical protein
MKCVNSNSAQTGIAVRSNKRFESEKIMILYTIIPSLPSDFFPWNIFTKPCIHVLCVLNILTILTIKYLSICMNYIYTLLRFLIPTKRLQFPQKTLHSFKALFSYNTSEPWFKQNYCYFHPKVPIVAMLVLLLTWIMYAQGHTHVMELSKHIFL